MNYRLVFRTRWGLITTVVVALLGGVFTAMIWQSEGATAALSAACLPLALTVLTWWIWGSVFLLADSRGITVRNQLRTWRIGWGDFKQASCSYGLYLAVDKGRVQNDTSEPSSGAAATGPDVSRPLTADLAPPSQRLYVAAVPAKGGVVSAAKPVAAPAELYFERGPRITLRTGPSVAASLLNEEAQWEKWGGRPAERMASARQVSAWGERSAMARLLHGRVSPEKDSFKGVRATWNWGAITAVVASALLALATGFGLL